MWNSSKNLTGPLSSSAVLIKKITDHRMLHLISMLGIYKCTVLLRRQGCVNSNIIFAQCNFECASIFWCAQHQETQLLAKNIPVSGISQGSGIMYHMTEQGGSLLERFGSWYNGPFPNRSLPTDTSPRVSFCCGGLSFHTKSYSYKTLFTLQIQQKSPKQLSGCYTCKL